MNNFKMNARRQNILDIARDWIGTPYMHQTSLKGVGCDCLGLIRGVWREIYGGEPEKIPNYTSDWSEVNGQESLLLAAQKHCRPIVKEEIAAGDILLFRMRKNSPAKHMGILSGKDSFIHAYEGNNVVESPLNEFWIKAIAAGFEFPDITTPLGEK